MATDVVRPHPLGKLPLHNLPNSQSPQKRRKILFDDDDSADDSDNSSGLGGVTLKSNEKASMLECLQVNEDYARQYEDKKTREELRRRKTNSPSDL